MCMLKIADNFSNDCAYGSIGFIILDMSCECFLCCVCYCGPHGRIVFLAKCVLPSLNNVYN